MDQMTEKTSIVQNLGQKRKKKKKKGQFADEKMQYGGNAYWLERNKLEETSQEENIGRWSFTTSRMYQLYNSPPNTESLLISTNMSVRATLNFAEINLC